MRAHIAIRGQAAIRLGMVNFTPPLTRTSCEFA